MSEMRKIDIKCETYTKWCGAANIRHHLDNYDRNMERMEQRLADAEKVIDYYANETTDIIAVRAIRYNENKSTENINNE